MKKMITPFQVPQLAGLAMVVLAILVNTPIHAQEFIDRINQDHVDFEEVRQETEQYFDIVGRGKGSGYKLFKRWEYRASARVMQDGRVVSANTMASVLDQAHSSMRKKSTATGDWSELGPLAWTNTAGYNPGVGRITAVAVEPVNQQLIYVGSPGGGLWKSTNGGSSWIPLGDEFGDMEIWGITIDPSNSNTIYVGNSIGELYKSTDAGNTFSLIMDQNYGRVFTILVHPTNSNIMHVAVRSYGLFRTTDGGASWTEVITPGIEDVVYKPGSTSTLYACGNDFYKSTDGGASFTQITSGFASSQRMKIGVSPANSNYVYVLQKSGSAFGWLYRSTDSGNNFTVMQEHTSSPNYIGSQASRDMAIAVSNTNINEVHIGGFDMYVSTNGGSSFVQECDWYYPSTTPGGSSSGHSYVHADIEVMQYLNGNIFVGSDGGIFKSTDGGDNFTDLSAGLGVHQFYRINSSATDKNRVVGGAQDNGTNVMSGTTHQWVHMMGADGMDCAIHPTNSNIIFGCTQYGSMVKSTNGGTSRTSMVTPPENGNGNWVTPIAIDPNNGNRIYAGYLDLYRHENLASSGSWVNTSTGITFNAKLRNIELCPSESNTIFVSTSSRVYKSADILAATPTWTEISGFSGTINDIAVDPYDEDRVVICTSSGNLYLSTDGGGTWTNINSGLPSVPFTSVVLDRSANKGIYVAIDGAVYFKNDNLSSWVVFSDNLPKVDIDEIEIFYGGAGEHRVRVGTYGRGLWESPLYDEMDGGSTGLGCLTTVSSYPYNESFESGLGAWTQGTEDDANWTHRTGGTPSSGTGPTGAADGTYYMYFETSSPNYPSKTALLESPCFDMSSLGSPELTFRYHMLGSTVGSLLLQATTDGTSWTTVWSRAADQGSAWNIGSVDLSAYSGSTVRLRFKATSGSSFTGDICIDQLSLEGTSGVSCVSTINSYPYYESFESGTGDWVQAAGDDADWTRHSGGTSSSGTGPTGAADGTYYMYFETSSPNYPTKTAYLESPCFNMSSLNSPQLSFKYHMLGATVGTLLLQATTDGINWSTVWSRSADQGSAWNNAVVDLSAYTGSTIKLRFNATSGSSWTGDMCIDQLSLEGSTAVSCASTVFSYPYSESFESGLVNWAQGTGDDADWTNHSGGTSSLNTGPDGAADGTYYMYFETSSPNYPSKTAFLESPCFDMSSLGSPELTFKYHMLGANVGSLVLEVSTDGLNWVSVWSRAGNQDSTWHNATVNLSAYSGSKVKLRFNATSGSNWEGDICIDQLYLEDTSPGMLPSSRQNCLSLNLTFDDYPEETSWEIRENGEVVASGDGYGSQLSGATIHEEFCVSEDCFEFIIKDSYGDGICCDKGEGYFNITNADGTVLASGGNFQKSSITKVCRNNASGPAVSGADVLTDDDVLIFPNPAVSTVHVQLQTKGESIKVVLMDISGKQVAQQVFDTSKGINLLKIGVTDLPAGTYAVRVSRGNLTFTKKLIIVN